MRSPTQGHGGDRCRWFAEPISWPAHKSAYRACAGASLGERGAIRRAPPASRLARACRRARRPRDRRGRKNPCSGRRAPRSAAFCRRSTATASRARPGLALTKASATSAGDTMAGLGQFEIIGRDFHRRARLAHRFEIGRRRKPGAGAVAIPFDDRPAAGSASGRAWNRPDRGRCAAPAAGNWRESRARIAAKARAPRRKTAAPALHGARPRGALVAALLDRGAVGRRPGQRQHVEIEAPGRVGRPLLRRRALGRAPRGEGEDEAEGEEKAAQRAKDGDGSWNAPELLPAEQTGN